MVSASFSARGEITSQLAPARSGRQLRGNVLPVAVAWGARSNRVGDEARRQMPVVLFGNPRIGVAEIFAATSSGVPLLPTAF
jgi:hypothetical protein